jgi:uncharacterized protein YkwD
VLQIARARRLAAAALICATMALGLWAIPASAVVAGGVAQALGRVGGTAAAVGRATAACRTTTGGRARLLCLVNSTRGAAGLAPVRANPKLARAASAHARDMARRGYFAHQRPGGPSLRARLRAAGLRAGRFGEAIAWGCGSLATPAATLRSWLASPPHRAILLSRAYRRAGIGTARGAPIACGGGAFWVLDTA